ncbi:hypothetical protein ACOQFV_24170 [Nocardiopsis changdeensis]|uniref:Uncharacterized protein n=1 Tax=Nocardiopsis changdeensis TaxID=2831969 RepID=A0A975KSG1_9ACTN|nr:MULTISPECIES: hypothetical protein [Nocardiopsis]QUX26509.1 hypothetical protein KGD84_32955 [Nocardiopsis changdeensis]QYX40781.1 hypothetical protein K1J57_32805 [Nocardiopsis sp. MT53]
MQHQITFAADTREFVEIDRTVTDSGAVLITKSSLVGLTETGQPERYHNERTGRSFDLHVYADASGERWHVATMVTDEAMKPFGGVTGREVWQVPAREWSYGYSSRHNFRTRRELLAHLGDEDARKACWEQLDTTMKDAAAAAAAAGGRVEYAEHREEPALLDRAAYTAACERVGLVPGTEDEIRAYRGLADRWPMFEYSVDHIVWTQLSRAYAQWLAQQDDRQAQRRLEQATAAHPGDAYSREQFEAASRAAGYEEPLPDERVSMILNPYCLTQWEEDPVLLALAKRRGRGMVAEAEQEGRRCDECGTLIVGSGHAASLGLACDFECMHAMSARPGRYATRHGS